MYDKKTYSLVKSLIKLKFHSSNFTYVNKNISSHLLEEIGLQKQIVHVRGLHLQCQYLCIIKQFNNNSDSLYKENSKCKQKRWS